MPSLIFYIFSTLQTWLKNQSFKPGTPSYCCSSTQPLRVCVHLVKCTRFLLLCACAPPPIHRNTQVSPRTWRERAMSVDMHFKKLNKHQQKRIGVHVVCSNPAAPHTHTHHPFVSAASHLARKGTWSSTCSGEKHKGRRRRSPDAPDSGVVQSWNNPYVTSNF